LRLWFKVSMEYRIGDIMLIRSTPQG
jgi:hypothetical protein